MGNGSPGNQEVTLFFPFPSSVGTGSHSQIIFIHGTERRGPQGRSIKRARQACRAPRTPRWSLLSFKTPLPNCRTRGRTEGMVPWMTSPFVFSLAATGALRPNHRLESRRRQDRCLQGCRLKALHSCFKTQRMLELWTWAVAPAPEVSGLALQATLPPSNHIALNPAASIFPRCLSDTCSASPGSRLDSMQTSMSWERRSPVPRCLQA